MKSKLTAYSLIVLLLSLAGMVYAQSYSRTIDSLQLLLRQPLADTVRVQVYNSLSSKRHGTNYAKAVEYATEAIRLSEVIGYQKGLAKGYQNIALTSWANGMYDDAIRYHGLAIEMFKSLRMDKELPEAYNKIGLVHFYIADYDRAIAYIEQSLEGYRALKDTASLARVLNNLGLVHDSRGEYAVSTQYIVESLSLSKDFSQLRDQQNRTYSKEKIHENQYLNNQVLTTKLAEIASKEPQGKSERLAMLHTEVAEIYFTLKDYQSALKYYSSAADYYELMGETALLGHCRRDQAECYVGLGNLPQAITLFLEAQELYKRSRNFIRLSAVVAQLAETNFQAGDVETAIAYYKRGLALEDSLGHKSAFSKNAASLSGVLLGIGRKEEALNYAEAAYRVALGIGSLLREEGAARQLYNCHKALGNTLEALKYLEESSTLRLQFDNELTNRGIAQLQVQFESQEKQKEIDQLNDLASLGESIRTLQRQLIFLLSLSLLAIILLLVVVNSRLKKIRLLNRNIKDQQIRIVDQNQKLEKRGRERELLIGEIHHRVKNNLQIISSLLRLQQREIKDQQAQGAILEAQNRVQSMSLLHQRLYQQGNHEFAELSQYAQDIFQHLVKVHKAESMDVAIKIQGPTVALSVNTAVTFGLVINEVFSNIFKHAYQRSKKLIVTCQVSQAGNKVSMSIDDNGPGFDLIRLEDDDGSFGINLIKMLLTELSGSVGFSNIKPTGARVEISFVSQT